MASTAATASGSGGVRSNSKAVRCGLVTRTSWILMVSPSCCLMLRREHGLALRQTRETTTELARTLLRP